MNTSKLLENKVVKFYSNPALHQPNKKVVTDDVSTVYYEGRYAKLIGLSIDSNPYSKDDNEAIWNKFDVWNEGFTAKEGFNA